MLFCTQVNDRIIMMACILVDCEFCDEKHSKPLRMAAANLKDLSGIDSEDWDLMKLATALKIICYPAERTISEAVVNFNNSKMCSILWKHGIHLMAEAYFLSDVYTR